MTRPRRPRRRRSDPEAELPDARPVRGRDPVPVTELLSDTTAARRGWAVHLEGARVHGTWPEIAGEQLAAHTEPVRLHGGVLVVRADSATWATQVRFLAAQLAQRANAVLGDGQVTQVTVVSGPLRGAGDS